MMMTMSFSPRLGAYSYPDHTVIASQQNCIFFSQKQVYNQQEY
jgi:hypothetical protein